VYVRLWTLTGGTWQSSDYTYKAGSGNTKAVMLVPAPAAVLGGASVTFTWSAGTGASAYWLDVGSTQGQGNIFGQNVALATSQTVTGVPTNGNSIYVRLWTLFGGAWQYNDYTYKAASGNSSAVMQLPAPNAVLSGASVTFTWSAASGAAAYWLDVGSTQGGANIFGQNVALATSQVVSGVPTNGGTVYVKLWTLVGGTWQSNVYTYKASGGTKAVLTAPVPTSVLTGSSVTLTWSAASGAAAYWVDVGTTAGGANLFGQNVGTGISQTVTGLPTGGSTIYVRLWTLLNGQWQFNDYTYKAAP
jgi:hypothetical protein